VLLHLVDLAAETGRAEEDLSTIEREMGAFDAGLLSRPRWIVGTKLDAAREDRRRGLEAAARRRGLRYLEISSVTQAGVRELVNGLRQLLAGMMDP
jgi:GTPase involved in cell partitioning and DNA repair